MGIKVISFCMWGNIQTYCIGCIKNVIIAKHLFPDWMVYIYYNCSVPDCIINWLKDQKNAPNVKLFFCDDKQTANHFKMYGQQGSIWRYFPITDPTVDVVVCRDIDSRLSLYEKIQIDRWLQEDSTALSLIDQYERENGRDIRGGTCAFKHVPGIDLKSEMSVLFKGKSVLPFYCDETLMNHIVRKYHRDVKYIPRGVRDTIEQCKSIPQFTQFVGDVLDENDVKLDKNTNNTWQQSILHNNDNQIIHKLLDRYEQHIEQFVCSLP